MDVIFKLGYYLCLLAKVIFLQLPFCLAKKLGVALALSVKIFLPERRRLVLENLSKTFKELKRDKILSIAENVWKNLGLNLVEFIKIEHINKGNYTKFVEFENEEYLKNALRENKGVFLLTAHLGNWELMGAALSLHGYKIMVVARALENKYVNTEVNRIRELSGEKIVDEHKGIRESLKWLKSNGCVGILLDQHITEGNVIVDFLGRPAATSPIIALLAKKTGAKIVPLYNFRLASGKIKIVFEKPVELKNTENHREDLITNTEIFNKIIGNWILKYPDQWFWLHNRWKITISTEKYEIKN